MSNLSPQCQSIQDEIDALNQDLELLQAQLQEASPGQKGSIASKIKALDKQIDQKKAQLAACVIQFPSAPSDSVDFAQIATTNTGPGRVDVFARDLAKQMSRTFSTTPESSQWPTAWVKLPTRVFLSGPAACQSSTGKELHVFGRGSDTRIWRAHSGNGGTNWTTAWAPIGQGTFLSAPAAATSADGKIVHVFGLGTNRTEAGIGQWHGRLWVTNTLSRPRQRLCSPMARSFTCSVSGMACMYGTPLLSTAAVRFRSDGHRSPAARCSDYCGATYPDTGRTLNVSGSGDGNSNAYSSVSSVNVVQSVRRRTA